MYFRGRVQKILMAATCSSELWYLQLWILWIKLLYHTCSLTEPRRMKDTPLANCERDFLLKAIEEKKVGWFLNMSYVSTLVHWHQWCFHLKHTIWKVWNEVRGFSVTVFRDFGSWIPALREELSILSRKCCAFPLTCLPPLQRLDGRQTYDYRKIKITFGTDYGCCFVDLGRTRWIYDQIK